MRILFYVALAVAVLANSGVLATAESDKVQLSNAGFNAPGVVANDGPKRSLRKHDWMLDETEERSKLSKLAKELKARKTATKKLNVAAQKMKAQESLNKLIPKNSISNEKFAGFARNKWTPVKAKSMGKIKTEAEFKGYAAFLLRQKAKAGAQ
jgi:hypothetical protein